MRQLFNLLDELDLLGTLLVRFLAFFKPFLLYLAYITFQLVAVVQPRGQALQDLLALIAELFLSCGLSGCSRGAVAT